MKVQTFSSVRFTLIFDKKEMDDHKFISELFKSDNVSYFKTNYLYFHVSYLLGLILIVSPIVYIIIRLLNTVFVV